jgi:hypothetical protein
MSFILVTEWSSAIIVGDVDALFESSRKFWGTALEVSTGSASKKMLCMGAWVIFYSEYWPINETNESWDKTFGQNGEVLVDAHSSMALNYESWHADTVHMLSVDALAMPGTTLRPMLFHWGPNTLRCNALLKSYQDCFQMLQKSSPDSRNAGFDTLTYCLGACHSYVFVLLGRQDLAQEHIIQLGTDPEHADATMDAWGAAIGEAIRPRGATEGGFLTVEAMAWFFKSVAVWAMDEDRLGDINSASDLMLQCPDPDALCKLGQCFPTHEHGHYVGLYGLAFTVSKQAHSVDEPATRMWLQLDCSCTAPLRILLCLV